MLDWGEYVVVVVVVSGVEEAMWGRADGSIDREGGWDDGEVGWWWH